VARSKINSKGKALNNNFKGMARIKQIVRVASKSSTKPRIIGVEVVPKVSQQVLFKTNTYELFTKDKYGYSFEWDDEDHTDFDKFEEQMNKFEIRYETVKPDCEYTDVYCSKFKVSLKPNMEVLKGLEKIRFSTSPAEYFLWRGVEQWMTKTGMYDEFMKALSEDEDWKENLFFLSIHEAYKSWDILLQNQVFDPMEYSADFQSRYTTNVTQFKTMILSKFSFAEDHKVGCFCIRKIMELIKSFFLNAMEVAAWMAMEAAIYICHRFDRCHTCENQQEFECLVQKMAEAVITVLEDNDQFEDLYKARLANVKRYKHSSQMNAQKPKKVMDSGEERTKRQK